MPKCLFCDVVGRLKELWISDETKEMLPVFYQASFHSRSFALRDVPAVKERIQFSLEPVSATQESFRRDLLSLVPETKYQSKLL